MLNPFTARAALFAVAAVLCPVPAAVWSDSLATSAGPVRIERVASGFDEPWGLEFLPGGGVLVTERAGQLTLVRSDGTISRVTGLPKVAAAGQGGLLDVMIPRDFPTSRDVFLSFATPQGTGEGTALGVGRLNEDGTALTGFRVIFEMAPGSNGGRHFGSRIVEARDGTLFLTIGERGEGMPAQALNRHQGKVVRITRTGAVPADNPFVGVAGALPEIYSLGHRNAQGAALDGQGRLWISEHGAMGGDEVNPITPGANYGWPVISYGLNYNGSRIGEGTSKPGMEQPVHYWDPSIAPSGLLIYSGKLWPDWRGDLFSGSLKFDHISRLDPDRPAPTGYAEERITAPETGRVRDLAEAPDGSIWFLSVNDGAVYRMVPD